MKVEPVVEHEFPVEKQAVGSIDFNEDMTVQIFPPYQGKIIDLYPKVGDEVTGLEVTMTREALDLLLAFLVARELLAERPDLEVGGAHGAELRSGRAEQRELLGGLAAAQRRADDLLLCGPLGLTSAEIKMLGGAADRLQRRRGH